MRRRIDTCVVTTFSIFPGMMRLPAVNIPHIGRGELIACWLLLLLLRLLTAEATTAAIPATTAVAAVVAECHWCRCRRWCCCAGFPG